MKKIKLILFILGYIISLTYPVSILFVEFQSCTQGSTNGFIVSGLWAVFITIVFLALANKSYKYFSKLWWLGLYHILSFISIIIILPNFFYYSFLMGISPCIVSNDFQAISDNGYLGHPWQYEPAFLENGFSVVQMISFCAIVFYFFIMRRTTRKRRQNSD